MADGILLRLSAPLYFENTWNMSSEQAAEEAGAFPFWTNEKYTPEIPPGDIGEWYVPEEDEVLYRRKLLGIVSGECFAAEIDSGPYLPEDIRYDEQKQQEYEDGRYAIQTFGEFIGVFAGEAYCDDISSGPADAKNIQQNQPNPQEYYDGRYSIQTFGEFIGVYSNDVFSDEITSGGLPINYNQKPETPYPDYKDPDWVVEDDGTPSLKLFIGARTGEPYSGETKSNPADLEDINDNQPPEQEYEDGRYASQTFDLLCHAVSGEVNAYPGVEAGCKSEDEEQIEQEYEDGRYATQVFGRFIGIYSADVFSNEIASAGEPINPNQKPETPYPDYKDPDWVVEEEYVPDTNGLYIGPITNEILANEDRSGPTRIEEIDENQDPPQDYFNGRYASQTFGQFIGVATGDAFSAEINAGVLEYQYINPNQNAPQDYFDGRYATQVFGKLIELYTADVFSDEATSGIVPINYNQKPEIPYPDYKDPEWYIPTEDEDDGQYELFIGLRSNEASSGDDRSAPIRIEDIDKHQPPEIEFEDGRYATQTFDTVCHAVSDEIYSNDIASGCKTKDDEQVIKDYEDGRYATQTFGKFIGVYTNECFAFESIVSAGEPINPNQKPETPYPNYKDPEWVVEDDGEKTTDELFIGGRLGEFNSNDMDSAPTKIEEIDKNQPDEIEYENGRYAVQTFDLLDRAISGEENAYASVLSGCKTDENEQEEVEYFDGRYATQAFGRFIGVYSNDAFAFMEMYSAGEPINPNQPPEEPYPDYKDPEWVVDDNNIPYGELYIGSRAPEINSGDSVSIPIKLVDIDDTQVEQEYENGRYAIQTFGSLNCNESGDPLIFDAVAGYKVTGDIQVEIDYVDGIYATQTFGNYVGTFSDDIFSFELSAGVEPIDETQVPEEPYPEYKDPEWAEEMIIVPDGELYIAVHADDVDSSGSESGPTKTADINPVQTSQDFSIGRYAIQTFGKFIGLVSDDISGFEELTSERYDVEDIDENQPEELEFYDGNYASQTFGGLIIGKEVNEIFSMEDYAESYPVNLNQPEEIEYPNYREPEWVIETEEESLIPLTELFLGNRAKQIMSNDDISAPMKINEINTSQKKEKEFKDGLSSSQTFGFITDDYSGDYFSSDEI